ncbi:hypothetical protein AVEN_223586-1 [Araneus ventricosus]|uniref:Uncharacterized protein n=1 Tax=Araneus ventricosus TaxID=182803 RepID=A0A4Y2HJR5_ARAVE|nr:hypothetical protein AVEN_223586-1 [Araneus ventricosus]
MDFVLALRFFTLNESFHFLDNNCFFRDKITKELSKKKPTSFFARDYVSRTIQPSPQRQGNTLALLQRDITQAASAERSAAAAIVIISRSRNHATRVAQLSEKLNDDAFSSPEM